MKPSPSVWFILRREPLYHKLQYSKVPKYDSSAAILGTVLGAFAGYLALATVGSGGTDLTDLTALVAWALIALAAVALSLEPRNHHAFAVLPPLALWLAPALALRPWVRRVLRTPARPHITGAAYAAWSRVGPPRVWAPLGARRSATWLRHARQRGRF